MDLTQKCDKLERKMLYNVTFINWCFADWTVSGKATRYVGRTVLWSPTWVPFSPYSVSSCWRTQGTTFQSPPSAWFQTVFPGKLLCLTSSISHAQEVHTSLPQVSLVWSVLIQFITSVSSFPPSTYIKTSINATRWTSSACYSMCSDVLPRAVGCYAGTNVELMLPKNCNVKRGKSDMTLTGYARLLLLLIQWGAQCFHTHVTFRPSVISVLTDGLQWWYLKTLSMDPVYIV